MIRLRLDLINEQLRHAGQSLLCELFDRNLSLIPLSKYM